MCPASQRVEVGHEAIAQTVVVDERLVGGVIVWGDIPNLAQGPLAMTAEEGDEGAELVPACLQLAPLLQVFVLLTCAVEQLLSLDVTVLHAEAALIHAPEGDA